MCLQILKGQTVVASLWHRVRECKRYWRDGSLKTVRTRNHMGWYLKHVSKSVSGERWCAWKQGSGFARDPFTGCTAVNSSTRKHLSPPLGGHKAQYPQSVGCRAGYCNLRQKHIRISCLARWLAYPHPTKPCCHVFSGGPDAYELLEDTRERPTKQREVRILKRGPDCQWRAGNKKHRVHLKAWFLEYSRKQTKQQHRSPNVFQFVSYSDPSAKLHFSWVGVEWRNSCMHVNLNQSKSIKNRIIK